MDKYWDRAAPIERSIRALREALMVSLSGGPSTEGADVGWEVGGPEVGIEEIDRIH